MTKNLDLYVRTDGNDSNNGLANTPAGAFKTIQKAINNLIDNYNLSVYSCIIHVGPGTFAGFTAGPYSASTGTVSIQGSGVDVTVIMNTNNTVAVFRETSRNWYLTNLTFRLDNLVASVASRNAIYIEDASTITFTGTNKFILNESAIVQHGLTALRATGGNFYIYGDLIVVANGLSSGSRIEVFNLSGFALMIQRWDINVSGRCYINMNSSGGEYRRDSSAGSSPTMTGSLTGQRYRVNSFGLLNTGGMGVNWFQGNSPGSVESSTFGIYR